MFPAVKDDIFCEAYPVEMAMNFIGDGKQLCNSVFHDVKICSRMFQRYLGLQMKVLAVLIV